MTLYDIKELKTIIENTSKKAVEDTLKQGISVTVVVGDEIRKIHPDGSYTFIKALPKDISFSEIDFVGSDFELNVFE